jgi:hypothetical protein
LTQRQLQIAPFGAWYLLSRGQKWCRRFADGYPLAALAFIALFGNLNVLFRLRSAFLRDEPLDQGKEAVVEIRIRNRFPSHDS